MLLSCSSAGWCEPCRQEAPALEAAHQQLRDRHVQIVEVLFQDAQALPATTRFCQAWTEEFGLSMPVLIDPVQHTLELFDVAQTPLHAVVDRSGRVLWSETGKLDDVVDALEPFIP